MNKFEPCLIRFYKSNVSYKWKRKKKKKKKKKKNSPFEKYLHWIKMKAIFEPKTITFWPALNDSLGSKQLCHAQERDECAFLFLTSSMSLNSKCLEKLT